MQCYESIGMCYAASEHVACHEAASIPSFLAFHMGGVPSTRERAKPRELDTSNQ
jgi:hypothetical protein